MTKADVYFAVVPEWVIYAVTPRALQVYAILRRHADYSQGDAETFVSRRKMAELGKCHVGTIDRALAELVGAGALQVEPRFADGRQTSNLYTVRSVPGGGRIDADGEVRNDTEGDVSVDAEGVTESQMTESHSTELALPGVKESHDLMVWALVAAMGWDRDEVPQAQWGRVHAAAKQLTAVGADPGEVPQRVLVYRAKYRGAALTPTAIATNWPALRSLEIVVSDRDVERASTRQKRRQAIAEIGGDE